MLSLDFPRGPVVLASVPVELIGRGEGVAILLNAHAKGVRRIATTALSLALPDAMILVSQSRDDARDHVRRAIRDRARLVLAGGGDGTLVGLLNLFRDENHGTIPTLGMLLLGTGNGWARATGAPSLVSAVAELPMLAREPPTRGYDLIDTEGTLCHFAGVGWDASILNEYAELGRSVNPANRWWRTGVMGYMTATFGRTVPKEYRQLRAQGPTEVEVVNLGEPAWTVDADRKIVPLAGDKGFGSVLYRGPMGVGGAATEPNWGFGFKSYPFAGTKAGWMSARVYTRPVLEAASNWINLWRGNHPQPGMLDFMVQHLRMTFSRPMPFQVGGDAMGLRDTVDYRVADQRVEVVDWNAARRGVH